MPLSFIVNQAIEQGVVALAGREKQDGSFVGHHAAAYPMDGQLACPPRAGEIAWSPRREEICRGLDYVRSLPFAKTYDAAVLLMHLECRSIF
ncbi:MAG: hypothetical protein AB1486_33880 [Planctomycetota bacterium]